MSKIAVVGSWHLAQVMATCFAEKGQTVNGVHHDAQAIASLASGVPTVFEPKMQASMRKSLKNGRLSWTTDYSTALRGVGIVFLSVDTPIHADGIDLDPIRDAVKRIARAARRKYLLVVSSQVPIGTCEELQKLARRTGSAPCELVCNPEFLRLGGAIDLQRRPDRIILGADDPKAARRVEQVYKPFKRPILLMSLREAEIVKHATNAYVANSVSFIGEIAQVCDAYGADAFPVAKALKLDRRVGKYAYVRPGLGFNGGTVARDVKLLISLAEDTDGTAPLMKAILAVNKRQNGLIAERLKQVLKRPKGKTIAFLGLTYKEHTSTLRHSLTLQIADQMLAEGMRLKAYDPAVPPDRSAIIPPDEGNVSRDIRVCASLAEAVDGADAIVVMTPKKEFRDLRLRTLAKRMKGKILVDAANMYEPADIKKAGFTYVAIGRGFAWS